MYNLRRTKSWDMSMKSILNSSLKVDDSYIKENQYQESHNHIF